MGDTAEFPKKSSPQRQSLACPHQPWFNAVMPPKIAGQAPTLHCQPTPCIGAACAAYYDLGPGLGGVCYAGSNLGFVIDGPGRARPNNGMAPGGVQ